MIAKISTGSYVEGMVKYNHEKIKEVPEGEEKGLLLSVNNIKSNDFKDIVDAISSYNSLNQNVTKPNIHISLSFHKDDILDNDTINNIADDYMKDMGYNDQPYVVYRHFDKEHPHIHIVSSQIKLDGVKIADGNNFYKSQKISRELEEKYRITKAVGKCQPLEEQNIEKAIIEHLEKGKHSLTAIMNKIISSTLEKRPTSLEQFDQLLQEFQLIRTIVVDEDNKNQGHYFDLRPIEFINTEPHSRKNNHIIEGKELNENYTLPKIEEIINSNKKLKEELLKNTMGRVYSLINPILSNFKNSEIPKENIKKLNLSTFIIDLKRKGIQLDIKRSQTGDNPNTIYGLIFKDIKEGISYSATDLKIKTKDFLLAINDDLKDLSEKEKLEIFSKEEDNDEKSKNPFSEDIQNIKEETVSSFDSLMKIFAGGAAPTQEAALPISKKRKRKRGL